MKKLILVAILSICFIAQAFAANTVIEFMDSVASGSSTKLQAFLPNPTLSIQVADNLAHQVLFSAIQVDSAHPILALNVVFGGSGTCHVRLMNSATVSAWPVYDIPGGTEFCRVLDVTKTLQLRYSSCYN